MFFAAGVYGAGFVVSQAGVPAAFIAGSVAGLLLALLVGVLALRTTGVSFMIVTMMFAQAFFLAILYFGAWTRGDEGFVIAAGMRRIGALELASPAIRYNLALLLLAAALIGTDALVRSPYGRVLVAIRENEPRTRMLGYDTFRYRLLALSFSGLLAGASGATYALLFAYVGATFAATPYSIYPILWGLLGGIGTTLGPLLGTGLMFYLIDLSSGLTKAYMLIVGLALVLVVIFFPNGILGTVRDRWLKWLP
jgi:branched-chain amino acid transport system permease protein